MNHRMHGGPSPLHLAEVVAALSLAIDLGTGQPMLGLRIVEERKGEGSHEARSDQRSHDYL